MSRRQPGHGSVVVGGAANPAVGAAKGDAVASGESMVGARVGLTRRRLLTRSAAAGAAAWVAPQIVSMPAAAAATIGPCTFAPILLAGGGSQTATATGAFVTVSASGVWWNSQDGGQIWTQLTGAAPPPASFVPTLLAGGGDNQASDAAFIAVSATNTWYRSTNGGATWTSMTNPFNSTSPAVSLLAGFGNASGDSADFVAFRASPTANQRWRRTINAGGTWDSPNNAQRPPATFTPNLLAGGGDNDSDRGDFVAIQSSNGTVYNSTNGGLNWTSRTIPAPAGVTWRLLAGGDDINGTFVVYGNNGSNTAATWRRSTNGGTTWAAPSVSSPPASFIPTLLAGSGDNDGQSPVGADFVATDGNGVWYTSQDFGDTWSVPVTPPPASFKAILLAGVGDGGGVNDFVATDGLCNWYRSADGGVTWTQIPAANVPR